MVFGYLLIVKVKFDYELVKNKVKELEVEKFELMEKR